MFSTNRNSQAAAPMITGLVALVSDQSDPGMQKKDNYLSEPAGKAFFHDICPLASDEIAINLERTYLRVR